jgi:hypothetical protein
LVTLDGCAIGFTNGDLKWKSKRKNKSN